MAKKKTTPSETATAPRFVNPNPRNVIVVKEPPNRGNLIVCPFRDRSRFPDGTFVVEGEFYRQFVEAGQLAPFPRDGNPTPVQAPAGNTTAIVESVEPGTDPASTPAGNVDPALVEAIVAAFPDTDFNSDAGVAILTVAHADLHGHEVDDNLTAAVTSEQRDTITKVITELTGGDPEQDEPDDATVKENAHVTKKKVTKRQRRARGK